MPSLLVVSLLLFSPNDKCICTSQRYKFISLHVLWLLLLGDVLQGNNEFIIGGWNQQQLPSFQSFSTIYSLSIWHDDIPSKKYDPTWCTYINKQLHILTSCISFSLRYVISFQCILRNRWMMWIKASLAWLRPLDAIHLHVSIINMYLGMQNVK
jgi:hypothetical protein